MKKSINFLRSVTLIGVMLLSTWAMAQQPSIQYFRPTSQDGVNMFETPKTTDADFEGVKVRVGGDFAIQFQGIEHSNDSMNLRTLRKDFNLPTANLNLDVQLHNGVRLFLATYLSSRHHTEAWVKGGYLQVDRLDFIKEGFAQGLMDVLTIKVGMDELNYGDTHFRRTDNARAIYNPFVGNYIMDVFTTEPFFEATVQKSGILAVLGLSNGQLNQNVGSGNAEMNKPSIYGKLGFDDQIHDDLRVRLTGSFLSSPGFGNGGYIYSGDRAGARYYWVLVEDGAADNFRSGRFAPGFKKYTSFQINPFVKFHGLEFFGVYEMSMGDLADSEFMRGGSVTQMGAELLYRFGGSEQFYLGGRYNSVSGSLVENGPDLMINRTNIGGGWFMTKNVLTKIEYVSQKYDGEAFDGNKIYDGAQFSGVVIEGAISF